MGDVPASGSALRDKLLAMMQEDQEARRRIGSTTGDEQRTIIAQIQTIDRRNTARMKEILDRHGWPTRSLVGEDGARAAWLLVQHADHDVAFQRRCLKLIEPLVSGREVDPGDVAYLTDRVLVNEGKPQVYGTQFHTVGGVLEPKPMIDPDHVDARRKAMGLSTLAEYTEQMRL